MTDIKEQIDSAYKVAGNAIAAMQLGLSFQGVSPHGSHWAITTINPPDDDEAVARYVIERLMIATMVAYTAQIRFTKEARKPAGEREFDPIIKGLLKRVCKTLEEATAYLELADVRARHITENAGFDEITNIAARLLLKNKLLTPDDMQNIFADWDNAKFLN